MTDGNTRKKAQAVFFSLVMVLSMVGGTVAFAGGAAGDVQDVNGLTAGDVTPGTDQVTQTVTIENVENDNKTDTINITNDGGLDDSIINESATSVTSTNHGSGATVRAVESDGTIVVDLPAESGTTADIVLEVGHNLSSVSQLPDGTDLPADVTYTATSEANSISVSGTFTVTEKQPAFSNQSATVPASAPNTIQVQLDEPVEIVGSATEVGNAFSLTNVTDSTDSDLTVDGASASGQTLTLELSGYVASNASDLEVSYTGADGDDPVVHANNNGIVALDSTDEQVTNKARPAFVDAEVTDANSDRLVVDFSEPLDSGSNSEIVSAFTLNGASIDGVYENTSAGSDDQVILTLTEPVAPGPNLALSYTGSDVLNSSLAGSNDASVYNFDDKPVTNNVVPVLQSAEVTDTNKNVIVASYQDGATVELGTVANFGGGTNTNLNIVGSSSSNLEGVSLASNEVALKNETAFTAADGSNLNLDDSGGAVDSTSGVQSSETLEVSISNNVTPTVESATVTNANPDQLRITFSESVQSNVSTGNIDSAVTDAFTLEDPDGGEFRVRNVSSIAGDTVTLNLGQSDGTPETVEVGDDLTDALSYDPTAPGDSAEQYPLQAPTGTSANVEAFDNQDVTNNVDVDFDVAEVTTNGDEIRVTFTNDVTQVGTDSEIEDAFAVGSDTVDLSKSSSYTGIENGDTVVFDRDVGDFVPAAEEGNYHSGTNFDAGNGISYTGNNGNDPLEIAATGDVVSDFSDQDIQNNIQPRIESAEVLDDDRKEIQVTYTENIADSDSSAYEAFSLSGSGTITDQNDVSTNTLDLVLDEGVAQGDTLGTLTYNGGTDGQEIISGNSDAVGVDGDSVSVDNSVGSSPVLQNVTIDDAAVNNDYSTDGEMLLAFDRPVSTTGTEASGLTFESNNIDVGVSITKINNTETKSPNNVVIAEFESDSGSESSNIQYGDDLSAATLTVDDASGVAIEGVDDNNQIAENEVTDVRNEIAGNLATVESTEIDAELIGTEVDTKGDFTVTVTGFKDDSGTKVVDDTAKVNIGGVVYDVTPNRFGASATVKKSPTSISKGTVEIGSEVTVDVTNAEVTNTENVTYVHEAFTQDEGWALTSQPMPGEFVAGDNINDVTYYDADAAEDASDFASYGPAGQVQRVHNALFVNAASDNAEYGFAYDEDRSGQQTNVGDVNMGEGWHIVGSNYDISGTTAVTLDGDLAIENGPTTDVTDVQQKSLPGTTLDNNYEVQDHAVYYVYLYGNDSRQIVLPGYTGTDDGSTGDEVVPAAK